MEGENYSSDEDSNYEVSDSVELHDSDYNIDDEDNRLFDENMVLDIDVIEKSKQIVMVNEEFELDCVEDNELVNMNSSDEEFEVFPRYHPKVDSLNKDFEFKLSMIFSSRDEFKNAVRLHAIHQGKEVKFARNDKKRIKVVCKVKDCPWVIWASPMQEGHCIQIKTFNPNHSCGWTYHNSTLTSTWLAKNYMHKFKLNPKLQARYFRDETMTQLKSHISKFQASRARTKALKLIQGTNEEQYQQIWNYCEEITSTNPGTTIVMKMRDEVSSGGQRSYQPVPDNYVHDCYNVNTYQRSYQSVLMPTKGVELWPHSEKLPPLPPAYPIRKGRPQTLRKRGPNEKHDSKYKMQRKQKSLRCSYCHVFGHNARGCSKKRVQMLKEDNYEGAIRNGGL